MLLRRASIMGAVLLADCRSHRPPRFRCFCRQGGCPASIASAAAPGVALAGCSSGRMSPVPMRCCRSTSIRFNLHDIASSTTVCGSSANLFDKRQKYAPDHPGERRVSTKAPKLVTLAGHLQYHAGQQVVRMEPRHRRNFAV